jgi:hypothetical protein
MLTQWLQGDCNVLSLAAIGGMGKSALTWAWVQRDLLGLPLPGLEARDGEDCHVPEAAQPEGLLWWSFYEQKPRSARSLAKHFATPVMAGPHPNPPMSCCAGSRTCSLKNAFCWCWMFRARTAGLCHLECRLPGR